jgi:hypothetical protein
MGGSGGGKREFLIRLKETGFGSSDHWVWILGWIYRNSTGWQCQMRWQVGLVAGESRAETGVGAAGEVDGGAGERAGGQEAGAVVGAGGPGRWWWADAVCGVGAGACATGG